MSAGVWGASPLKNARLGENASLDPKPDAAEMMDDVTVSSGTKKGVDFIFAPIPFSNPTTGAGLAGMASLIYPLSPADAATPPSMTGLGGFYSENDSWGAFLFQRLYLPGGRWRFNGGLAMMNFNYNYYGIGTEAGFDGQSIPVHQRINGLTADALYRTWKSLFAGMTGVWSVSDVSMGGGLPPAGAGPGNGFKSQIGAVGPRLQWDTRDNTFSAATGSFFDGSFKYYGPALGSDYEYNITQLEYNHYWSPSEKHVWAARGYGRFATGDVPFYALSQFGMKSDLRGYVTGQFRDNMMIAVQAESRWRLTRRFGAAAFVGVGEVAPTLNSFNLENLLPSVGGGIRYILSEQNRIVYRIDYAVGKGEQALYFNVGEAF